MEDAHKSHNRAEHGNEAFPCQLSRLFTLILFISQTQDCLKGVSAEKHGGEAIFYEITVDHFSNLRKDLSLQILPHIVVKLQNIKNSEMISKERNIIYKGRKYQKEVRGGFPGGAVVEGLPAGAGDTGSSPGLGRSHMPRSN